MSSKLYMSFGAMALAFVACSEDNVGGTSVEPNTTYAEGYWLWNPLAGDLSVNTARYAALLPEDVEADGHWFWETREEDSLDGGQSSIIWPVELGDGVDALSTVIESCQGICGTASLVKAGMTYNPYVGVGFVIARDETGNPTPVDVSNWGGVCITYSSEAIPSLVLDLGDSLRKVFDDGASFPAVSMPRSSSEITKCFAWSAFKIPSWRNILPEPWETEAGWRASKQLVGLVFRIQSTSGEYRFNIRYVGTKEEYGTNIKYP